MNNFSRRVLSYISDCFEYRPVARRGGVEVSGWTTDWEIRIRFPAYPRRGSDGKEVKDVFERPGARVGVGSTR